MSSSRLPNFLFLVAEDTGRTQGCYGNPCARTPAIDQLAAEGTRYTNAFSTAPVCAPSRCAIVTGATAFSQGAHHMRSTLRTPPRLFTQNLQEAGYYVNWANKTDFNFEPPADFATERSPWVERLAANQLPDQPWFLYHNFEVTHESGMWPAKFAAEIAPHLAPQERCAPGSVSVPEYLPDTPEVRADIARHYDCLTVQDKQIGEALRALDDSGQRGNTIVFYLSDHGRGLTREKRWCYSAGIHLPLIISAPGLADGGAISDELVSWLDLAPTILSLAGAEPLPGAQGRVFLGPGADLAPDYVFAGRDRMDEVFDRVRVARSQRYHYIRNDFPGLPYAARQSYMEQMGTAQALREMHANGALNPAQSLFMAATKPPEELYDAVADPDCITNLAHRPEHAETLERHRDALATFLAQTGDLGEVPERELVERGLVVDRLEEYRQRVQPLPERYRIGAAEAPLEMPG